MLLNIIEVQCADMTHCVVGENLFHRATGQSRNLDVAPGNPAFPCDPEQYSEQFREEQRTAQSCGNRLYQRNPFQRYTARFAFKP